ncbi:LexA/Signal peptidase [Patellaria atrata CBS 101060]|uniref:LexA/Signal peptidase n=1 Tax=Patellaria atrata CBS 101060 TaxID=1346257 RepID=A0A9P4S8Z4_9PEZI|nr:LexA/Signal peptidase [Patellaria atrata CBS 101060]
MPIRFSPAISRSGPLFRCFASNATKRNVPRAQPQPQPKPKLNEPSPQKLEASNQYPKEPWYRVHIRIIGKFAGFSLILHVVSTYGYSINLTGGISMLPTVAAQEEWVLLSKYHRRGRDIEVGDVVSYYNPLVVGQMVMKRVIGMPGDFVLRDTPGRSDVMVQVPEGHFWSAGDNQAFSRDSRIYGPIPLALIRGKVIASGFPSGGWKWIVNTLKEPEEFRA